MLTIIVKLQKLHFTTLLKDTVAVVNTFHKITPHTLVFLLILNF